MLLYLASLLHINTTPKNENKLKYIPVITILLWLSMVIGYIVYPGFFLKEFVQYPLIIFVSILLPVSFWLQAQARKRFFALFFLGIFFLNISLLIFALEKNYSSQRIVESNVDKGILPEIAEMLIRDENIEKRKLAAQYIYRHHAVQMAYKNADTYTLYAPTATDKEQYRAYFIRNAEIGTARMNAIDQLLSTFFLLILHSGIFLCLILFLILHEQKDPPVEI